MWFILQIPPAIEDAAVYDSIFSAMVIAGIIPGAPASWWPANCYQYMVHNNRTYYECIAWCTIICKIYINSYLAAYFGSLHNSFRGKRRKIRNFEMIYYFFSNVGNGYKFHIISCLNSIYILCTIIYAIYSISCAIICIYS